MFVVCLVLGVVGLGPLLWRVSGFTLGHSVTLAAGFFGYTPQGVWFVPLVETGIALSIVYAAIMVVLSVQRAVSTWVTVVLGLLHGLGFSFVLSEMLPTDAPDIWQSLLAFNIGVEIGQIGVVLATLGVLFVLSRVRPARVDMLRTGLAMVCIVIASVWVGQRSLQLIAVL